MVLYVLFKEERNLYCFVIVSGDLIKLFFIDILIDCIEFGDFYVKINCILVFKFCLD